MISFKNYWKDFCLLIVLLLVITSARSQNSREIAFISDMQKPLCMEKLFSKTEQNKRAIDSLSAYILKRKPSAMFFLGDMVACGSLKKSWKTADLFLNSLKSRQIPYYAIMGNHEYMFNAKKGKINFDRRFVLKDNIIIQSIDSIAIVMLNSNFGKLTSDEISTMLSSYTKSLDSLQLSDNVKYIVVAAHHSPFTNSKRVKPSKDVEKMIVPKYLETPKAVLFLSGHAHLAEIFNYQGKYFCVIGGGGGIWQNRRSENKRQYNDLLNIKPFRFFYCTLRHDANFLYLNINGIDEHWNEKTEELLKTEIK